MTVHHAVSVPPAGGPPGPEAGQPAVRQPELQARVAAHRRLRLLEAAADCQRPVDDALLHGLVCGARGAEAAGLRRLLRRLGAGRHPLHHAVRVSVILYTIHAYITYHAVRVSVILYTIQFSFIETIHEVGFRVSIHSTKGH